jgi:hypothetical protein
MDNIAVLAFLVFSLLVGTVSTIEVLTMFPDDATSCVGSFSATE